MANIFRKKPSLMNVLVVAVAIVTFWRGAWGLLDLYLFPEDPLISYVVSLALGLVILWIDDFRLDELN